MSATSTTRRALLGATVAAVALAPALPVCAAAAPAGVSAELLALLAAAREANQIAAAYHRDVYAPANARRDAAVAAAKASLPHTLVDAGENHTGNRITWTTANRVHVAIARSCAARREGGLPADYVAAARKLTAAHLRRERVIDRARRTGGIYEMAKRSDALCDTSAAAETAVADFPARTLADLAVKLAFMVERDMGDGVDWLPELLADAQRITGEVA